MDFFTLLAACIFAVQMAYAATPIHAMQPADQFGNFSDTINSTRASDDSDLKRDTGYSERKMLLDFLLCDGTDSLTALPF